MSIYSVIIIGFVIIFALYRRMRRFIGWQSLGRSRLMIRTVLFCVIGIIILGAGLIHPISLISDLIGMVLGVLLAFYSASVTQFEEKQGQWYYRPNSWVGSFVIFLFVVRLIYRFYMVYAQGSQLQTDQAEGWQALGNSIGPSWTAGLLLIMFGYFVTYNIILLVKQNNLTRAEQ
ncbi:hypothetical protein GCM10011391_05630 [Pullulanibacillus camelliae]|uniref:DUF1453 domain-containing protein n=1 Tax=Pullulanibacillus camelliae TaxID=1707096 RepID=A0A8J2YAQ4_9BACL|nr:CcdC protein domain-containing protein [Pullulanibacillus camelliae]GGE29951.1 hypothetical protein GCM10011391_05630 [Pullulanibacillus camelliae]